MTVETQETWLPFFPTKPWIWKLESIMVPPILLNTFIFRVTPQASITTQTWGAYQLDPQSSYRLIQEEILLSTWVCVKPVRKCLGIFNVYYINWLAGLSSINIFSQVVRV